MKRALLPFLLIVAIAGCSQSMSPELLQQYQNRTLYTCCNIHYESSNVSDANYYVGGAIPFGTAAQVKGADRGALTIRAGAQDLTLHHRYGSDNETFQQYIDKVLVSEDPKIKASGYSQAAQQAIKEGRVELGMTKDQVVMSLGYPPAHRTPSLDAWEWTYWYNQWLTYRVQFGEDGKVAQLIGTQLPSRNQAVTDEPPPAKAAKQTQKAAQKKNR
jgi:outer membrane protein assembly factor BamE (lipoprotein component of BamABCDE complex)